MRFQGTLFQMLRQMGDVFEQALYIRDLRSFVESPTEQGAGWEELPEQPLDIAVEGLGFAYGDGPPVLNGVELRFRPGEKLALVRCQRSWQDDLGQAAARVVSAG